MSFFVFGPDNMSRTQLEAFERSCREWIDSPPELTTPDLWASRRRTAESDTEAAAVDGAGEVEVTPAKATTPLPRLERGSVVSRMRNAVRGRARGRVAAR